MRRHRSGGRSVRQLRVGEELRHALAGILIRDMVQDPVLEGRPITVSEVRISPDLGMATVFVVPLGGLDQEVIVDALNRHAGFLRGCLGREIYLRRVPEIEFSLDTSFDQATKIEQILAKEGGRRDDSNPEGSESDGEE
ncbi:MAG: 30S ribosome-binding factor RbfA [Sphingomonadales bacterium]